ncbi:MAG: NAD(P)/FAD-dependent oxidoreductase [Planctomycetota bacterium]|nr:NAD(P)/FAD-dependent oxidoreductase [Planctomycetota bacterium]
MLDAIIIGGGPAGLSAALVLGRCRRRVLLIDAGRPRNYAARRFHNFLSRDGEDPAQLLRLGRAEIARYGVELRPDTVTRASCTRGGFEITTAAGHRASCRTLLLATGVVDELPAIDGAARFYGSGLHHCPYCDAWEYSGRSIAAYGRMHKGIGLGMSLLTWSPNVTVLTDGQKLRAQSRRDARELGLTLREEKIARLEPRLPAGPGATDAPPADILGAVVFQTGERLEIDALFFNTGQYQRSALASTLGCSLTKDGGIARDKRQRTGVPGLYLAGDASHDVQLVIVAAAEGAKAGMAMNGELQRRDRGEEDPE